MYERIWQVTCIDNGFKYKVFIRTTEQKLQEYMETELPYAVNYSGATDKEVEAAKLLGLPIYCY